ncbi:hypothetical protein HZH66_009591 [Vespula vulgaris]|uniref:Ig-like domain-containing protein n=1 Tax=Vespula vulgaris TaxID=7454 RepID=A0A834JTA2_VESVU|nr:hypothetical protein HZH66_009591 [Vespula vulgaris]
MPSAATSTSIGCCREQIRPVVVRKPKPQVVWSLGPQKIDAPTEVRETQGPEGESNVITISNVTVKGLTRSHHHAKLSCEASNTHLAPPPRTTVTIELNNSDLTLKLLVANALIVTCSNCCYRITILREPARSVHDIQKPTKFLNTSIPACQETKHRSTSVSKYAKLDTVSAHIEGTAPPGANSARRPSKKFFGRVCD